MKILKISIVIALAIVCGYALGGTKDKSLGGPSMTYQKTILPEADSTYDLGSSTLAWYKTNSDEFCLTGDSCISSWGAVSSPLTTKGDLYTYSTTDARLPIGTDDYVLTADSTEATGMKWAVGGSGSGDVVGPSSATDNAIVRYDGATGKLIQDSSVLVHDTGAIVTSGDFQAGQIIGSSFSTSGEIGLDGSITERTNSTELLSFIRTSSAVNEITIKNNITANSPEVQATGDDTNIDLKLVSKGTGQIDFNGNYKFPLADGTAGQVLQTDGSGNLSWVTP